MRIRVVIPCHHRLDLLERALNALPGREVLVVDDSPDGRVRPRGVDRVRTMGEVGFASAANAGIAAAEADGSSHVFLLNDDAVPSNDCLDRLAEAWTEDTGVVGPLIYGPEGLESAGFELSWWGRVRSRRTLGRDARAEAMRRGEVVEVAAISGAAMLLSSCTRLDPAFRHGFEDLALCRSLRASGRRVLLAPAARVLHLGGGTVERTSREAQRHAISGHLRYLGGGWRGGVAVGLAVAQVIREGGPPDRLAGLRDGVRDWRERR